MTAANSIYTYITETAPEIAVLCGFQTVQAVVTAITTAEAALPARDPYIVAEAAEGVAYEQLPTSKGSVLTSITAVVTDLSNKITTVGIATYLPMPITLVTKTHSAHGRNGTLFYHHAWGFPRGRFGVKLGSNRCTWGFVLTCRAQNNYCCAVSVGDYGTVIALCITVMAPK